MQKNRFEVSREYVWPPEPPTPTKAIMTVIGGMILNLFGGSWVLWGSVALYVLSYYRLQGSTGSYDFIFLVDSIMGLSSWLGMLVGTELFQREVLNVR